VLVHQSLSRCYLDSPDRPGAIIHNYI